MSRATNEAGCWASFTLVELGVAAVAGNSDLFGHASRHVETISYSATLCFHLIPGVTETSTRLPLRSPLVANADAPALQMATEVLFVAFLDRCHAAGEAVTRWALTVVDLTPSRSA